MPDMPNRAMRDSVSLLRANLDAQVLPRCKWFMGQLYSHNQYSSFCITLWLGPFSVKHMSAKLVTLRNLGMQKVFLNITRKTQALHQSSRPVVYLGCKRHHFREPKS